MPCGARRVKARRALRGRLLGPVQAWRPVSAFALIRGTLLLPQDEDESLSLAELLATSSGRWTVALEVIATIFMLPFMYIGAAVARESGHVVRAVIATHLTSPVLLQLADKLVAACGMPAAQHGVSGAGASARCARKCAP